MLSDMLSDVPGNVDRNLVEAGGAVADARQVLLESGSRKRLRIQ
jgi:hypothetical protein